MKLFGACLALLAIVGCSPKPLLSPLRRRWSRRSKPVASVVDLVLGQIDPLPISRGNPWRRSPPTRASRRQPRTDAEWAEVRHKALAVIEGATC
jgi:hypothetical protein